MHSLKKGISTTALAALLSAAVVGSMFAFATPALAASDPGDCIATGVALSLVVYRADGTTPVGAGAVVDGETIKYQAILSHAGAPNCNYQGGNLAIVTPDGFSQDVDGGVVPLISAGNPFSSSQVSYVVSAANVGGDGDLDASAVYTGGTSLLGDGVSPVDATTPAATPFVQPLLVSKTANTSFDRSWDWSITKSADQTDLLMMEGQTFDVNYTVQVDSTPTDSNHMVSGTVTITNPANNPDATVESVSDSLDMNGLVTLVCDQNGQVVLSAGESINCTYSTSVPNTDDTENVVTVVTSGVVPGGSDDAAVSWGAPANLIDECIVVDDTFNVPGAPAGTVICFDAADKSFDYTVTMGEDVALSCGENEVPNTASFVTQDDENNTAQIGSDDWIVTVTIADCAQGCTLTQGYWKTHNDLFKGGAPSDDNWANVGGPGADFYSSGASWFDVFWTAPKGNAYYNLAHQYMAAVLNVENGAAVPPQVQDALDDAKAFFETYSPAAFANLGKKNSLRKDVITWAGILGSYNEGAIGPGHCDEQTPQS